MLLFTGGSFLQMLEGDAERIDELYARLAGDERHARLTQIVREPIQGRLFGDWSMDFAAVDPTDGAERMAAGRSAMLEARRRFRLLERLKQRRLEDWRLAGDKELEELASESYLARWTGRLHAAGE